jgi:Spy/CpxP family protein refolding chaperone
LNKYIQLQNDLNEINKIIEESKEPKIRKDIESKIKYIENQIAANSSESEKIKKQIEKIQNSINENKSEMEKYLSQTLNKEMKIRIL